MREEAADGRKLGGAGIRVGKVLLWRIKVHRPLKVHEMGISLDWLLYKEANFKPTSRLSQPKQP